MTVGLITLNWFKLSKTAVLFLEKKLFCGISAFLLLLNTKMLWLCGLMRSKSKEILIQMLMFSSRFQATMILSSLYHTFTCHSVSVSHRCLTLDLVKMILCRVHLTQSLKTNAWIWSIFICPFWASKSSQMEPHQLIGGSTLSTFCFTGLINISTGQNTWLASGIRAAV